MSLLTLERAVGAGTPVAPTWGWKYWGVEAKLGGHKENREGRDVEGPEYLARLGGLKACRKEGKVCPGWTAVPTGCQTLCQESRPGLRAWAHPWFQEGLSRTGWDWRGGRGQAQREARGPVPLGDHSPVCPQHP